MDKYVGNGSGLVIPSIPAPQPSRLSNEEMAKKVMLVNMEIIRKKERLEAEGYSYEAIQK